MKKRHSVQLSPGEKEDKVLEDKEAISKKLVPRGGGGVHPWILDRGVPRRFVNPNPI